VNDAKGLKNELVRCMRIPGGHSWSRFFFTVLVRLTSPTPTTLIPPPTPPGRINREPFLLVAEDKIDKSWVTTKSGPSSIPPPLPLPLPLPLLPLLLRFSLIAPLTLALVLVELESAPELSLREASPLPFSPSSTTRVSVYRTRIVARFLLLMLAGPPPPSCSTSSSTMDSSDVPVVLYVCVKYNSILMPHHDVCIS
jgi:hypothetical protein